MNAKNAMTMSAGDDSNATELLHKLLEKRGVEYTYRIIGGKTYTSWGEPMVNGAQFIDGGDWTELTVENVTPKQAITATLGRPKVRKVRGLTYDEHGGEVYYLACSGCGDWVDGDLDCIGEYDGPNFCHNCGGEFDGPLLCRVCGELADMEFGDMCAECYEGEGNDE